MEAWYDIPYDVPKQIHSDIPDLVNKSTIHYLHSREKIVNEQGLWLFPFPDHEGACWTNFKYVCHGIEQSLEVGLVARMMDGTWFDILPSQTREHSHWHPTKWPLPSVSQEKGTYYLSVKPLIHNNHMKFLRIKILGFTDLFPTSVDYVFLDSDNKQEWVLLEKEGIQVGKEWNVENGQKIRLIQSDNVKEN